MRYVKPLLLILAICVLGLLSPGVSSATQNECAATTIMPVGDSRVVGDRPRFESYRHELWSLLVTQGVAFDFVGPFVDAANYPKVKKYPFDRDHAGAIGYSTTDLLANLDDFLRRTGPPDIVLLGIGGNDLIETNEPTEKIVGNIGEVIKKFRAVNPQVVIFLEQIAPGHSRVMDANLQSRVSSMNKGIASLAKKTSNPESRIIVVDMSKAWSDRFMADDVHYNNRGSKNVAGRYFEALMELPELKMDRRCE